MHVKEQCTLTLKGGLKGDFKGGFKGGFKGASRRV